MCPASYSFALTDVNGQQTLAESNELTQFDSLYGAETTEVTAQLASDSTVSKWDGSVDVSWYNTTDTEFHITTAAQLAGLVAITSPKVGSFDSWNAGVHASRYLGITQDNFKGKTVVLDADLDLSGYQSDGTTANLLWNPISDLNNWGAGGQGTSDGTFDGVGWEGTFDGNGHTISNMRVDGKVNCSANFGGYQGLFSAIRLGGVIKNLGITSGTAYGRVCGGIVGISSLDYDDEDNIIAPANQSEWPLVENCYTNLTITGNGATSRPSGGIFGGEGARNSWCAIVNCYVLGSTSNGSTAGGVAGYCNGILAGCYNVGSIPSSVEAQGSITAGLQSTVTDDAPKLFRNDVAHGFVNNMALTGTSPNFYRYGDCSNYTDPKPVTEGFSTADQIKAGASYLGSGYVADTAGINSGYPILFWQNGDAQTDLSSATVSAIEDQYYTKSEVEPDVAVTLNGKTLTYGTDYLVSYDNNVEIGNKTASATVIGVGAYEGQCAPVYFSIITKSVDTFTIDSILPQWRYDAPVTPVVTVKNELGTVLEKGVDYNLIWKDNDAEGTATVTVCDVNDPTKLGKSATFQIVNASSALEGSGTEADPWQIANRKDLQLFAYKVNNGDEAYTKSFVTLTADIDTTPATNEPDNDTIGMTGTLKSTGETAYRSFLGTFDGDNHSITLAWNNHTNNPNLNGDTITNDSAPIGLFGTIYDPDQGYNTTVTIKNLTTKGSISYEGTARQIGALAGYTDSAVIVNFENVTNETTITGTSYTGGFVGYSQASGTLKNCVNKADITSSYTSGGFLGYFSLYSNSETDFGHISYEDCTNEGDVTVTADGAMAAGFSAYNSFRGYSTVSFTRCANTGNIESRSSAGGFMSTANLNGQKGDFVMDSCYNTGNITNNAALKVSNVGGLLGTLPYGKCTITSCYNTGDITNNATASAYYFTGGLIGNDRSTSNAQGDRHISGYNAGTVKAKISHGSYNAVGAIVGDVKAGGTKLTVTSTYDCSYREGCVVNLDGTTPTTTPAIGYDESNGTTIILNNNMVSRTADFMKTAEMVTILNGASGTSWKADGIKAASKNDGYPILSWQSLAAFYTVTFDNQGIGTAPEAQTVKRGEMAEKPADLTADNYNFGGWFKEPLCENTWNFDTDTVNADTTLYAKWTIRQAYKDSAATAIDTAASAATSTIEGIADLTSSQKANAVTAVANAQANAKAEISNAKTVEAVDTAKQTGTNAIAQAVQDAQNLAASKSVPTKNDLTYTAPTSTTYDGKAKVAFVTGKQGMGAITVRYRDASGNELASAPVEVGTYYVVADVALGDTYKAASNIVVGSFTISTVVEKQPVYRLYNPLTSEHLWTTDANEYYVLTLYGWNQEGVAWSSPESSAKPVYRLYNESLHTHHYTSDQSEIATLTAQFGWVADNGGKPLFYSAVDASGQPLNDASPVMRMYNGGLSQHLLTMDMNEYGTLANYSWNPEGVSFYAFS